MHATARALQLTGLVVAGMGFFAGFLGGNIRLELALLALGAAVFFLGSFLQKRGR